jgi:hypothetical protein
MDNQPISVEIPQPPFSVTLSLVIRFLSGEKIELLKITEPEVEEFIASLDALHQWHRDNNKAKISLIVSTPKQLRNLIPYLRRLFQNSLLGIEEKTLLNSAVGHLLMETPTEIYKKQYTKKIIEAKLLTLGLSFFSVPGKATVLNGIFAASRGDLATALILACAQGAGYTTLGVIYSKLYLKLQEATAENRAKIKKLFGEMSKEMKKAIENRINEPEIKSENKLEIEPEKDLQQELPETDEELLGLLKLINQYSYQLRVLNQELQADIESIVTPTGRSRVLKYTSLGVMMALFGTTYIGPAAGVGIGLGAGVARWLYGTRFTGETTTTTIAKSFGSAVKVAFAASTIGVIPLSPPLTLSLTQLFPLSDFIKPVVSARQEPVLTTRDLEVLRINQQLIDAINQSLARVRYLTEDNIKQQKYDNYTAVRTSFANQDLSGRWNSQGHFTWETAERL